MIHPSMERATTQILLPLDSRRDETLGEHAFVGTSYLDDPALLTSFETPRLSTRTSKALLTTSLRSTTWYLALRMRLAKLLFWRSTLEGA